MLRRHTFSELCIFDAQNMVYRWISAPKIQSNVLWYLLIEIYYPIKIVDKSVKIHIHLQSYNKYIFYQQNYKIQTSFIFYVSRIIMYQNHESILDTHFKETSYERVTSLFGFKPSYFTLFSILGLSPRGDTHFLNNPLWTQWVSKMVCWIGFTGYREGQLFYVLQISNMLL